jgi:hypothetical protein
MTRWHSSLRHRRWESQFVQFNRLQVGEPGRSKFGAIGSVNQQAIVEALRPQRAADANVAIEQEGLLPATFKRHRIKCVLMDTQRAVRASKGDQPGIGIEAKGRHAAFAKICRSTTGPTTDIENRARSMFQKASLGRRRSITEALNVQVDCHAQRSTRFGCHSHLDDQ